MEGITKPNINEELEQPDKLDNIIEIENRFLQNQYPLSAAGEALRTKIEHGHSVTMDELPTVENPKPELFADLKLDGVEGQIFGERLSNIQVTKGCRHKCTFCAAGAAHTVESMPFSAIVKLAEQKQMVDSGLENAFVEWQKHLEQTTGVSIEVITKVESQIDSTGEKIESGLSRDEETALIRTIIESFNTHPFKKIVEEYRPDLIKAYNDLYSKENALRLCFQHVPITLGGRHLSGYTLTYITNFYDSDPFDYRDRTFLHMDGSVADFGDVAKLLSSEARPIHITTAGWSSTDPVAQRAADKVVAMGPTMFNNTRLSVNQYEVRARKNLAVYLQDTLNSIATLSPIGLQVLIFDDGSNPDYTEMCSEIKSHISGTISGNVRILEPVISHYSGPMSDGAPGDDHHDVMACMPGFHIWPNGVLAEQGSSNTLDHNVPKGSRPTPVGKNLWELKKTHP
jgi:hypothetical protein